MTRDPTPTKRSWERRHRISELLREATRLAQQESIRDHEDRQVVAFLVRLGLLYEDSVDLEERALTRPKPHDRDRDQ